MSSRCVPGALSVSYRWVPDEFPVCSRCVPGEFQVCTRRVRDVLPVSSRLVPGEFPVCFWCVTGEFPVWSRCTPAEFPREFPRANVCILCKFPILPRLRFSFPSLAHFPTSSPISFSCVSQVFPFISHAFRHGFPLLYATYNLICFPTGSRAVVS